MAEARPSARWEVRPGKREIDSAMLVSGSLPMSSAEIASTMLLESRLSAMALSMPARMPVTTTSSIVLGRRGLGVCGGTARGEKDGATGRRSDLVLAAAGDLLLAMPFAWMYSLDPS